MLDLVYDWKFWAVVIAIILSMFFMQTTKPNTVIPYETVLDEATGQQEIIVVVYTPDLEVAKSYVKEHYQDYEIAEYHIDTTKKRIVMRLVRRE